MFRKLFLFTILFTFVQTPSANAETGYRYWGYFQAPAGASNWTAAMTGPSVEVRDGDVEGWTFTASSNDIPAKPPMMDPDFAELCGEVSEVAGKVRVGLVVDFGIAQIAPASDTPREFFRDCVVVDQGSVGLDVLNAVLEVRAASSGLICGIAGYPSQECGAEIDMSVLNGPAEEPLAIKQTGENEAASNNSFALIGLAVIALLAGVVALRRRSAK